MNEATMTNDAISRMHEMAKLENKRLRQITGNHPSHAEWKKIKERAAKGGTNSHKFGSKKGKNGLQAIQNRDTK